MSSMRYRSDIDGLRAIAVMSVVLFHADFTVLAGGFVGVDVFFVISGFLITRLIRDAHDAGTFEFSDFYLRRARRLFPALLATLGLVLVVGAWLFLPVHFQRLGGALASGLVWSSNIFFWQEADYFDAASSLKPLLHTWSLGVEEQFYLVWPGFLVALCAIRRSFLLPGILIASVASLGASQLMLHQDSAAAFFLMPFRVFEFGIGALLVWVSERRIRSALLLDALLLAGLAIVGVCFLTYDERLDFPGVNALLPCIGTALIIYAGQARLGRPLLCNPVSIYLGRISYSLYLVHWPVVVFYKYSVLSFGIADRIAVVAIAIALAALMYRFLETPLRKPAAPDVSPSRFLYGCLGTSLVLGVLALSTWFLQGWPQRWDLPASIQHVATYQKEMQDRSWDLVNNLDGRNDSTYDDNLQGKVRVLLVGDSHSKDMFNALALNQERFDWLEVRRLALHDHCLYVLAELPPPEHLSAVEVTRCGREIKQYQASQLPKQADWVLFSARWKPENFRYLADYQAHLNATTRAQLGLFGRTAEFADIPQLAVRHGQLEGLGRYVAQFRDQDLDALNTQLQRVASELSVPYIDKLPLVCAAEECDVVDRDENLLFYDYGHWTLDGARHFGAKMAGKNTLSELRPSAS